MGEPTDGPRKKRILWLHTQPEHYFNRMMDDLARGTPYTVPGMPAPPPSAFEYIAAFAARGPGWYAHNAPAAAETVFLKVLPKKEGRSPAVREQYHVDWRADLLPLKFDAAIVSGYAWRTQRELIAHCRRCGLPVALWTDSNLRSQRGAGFQSRLRRAMKKRFLRRIVGTVDHIFASNRLGVAYWRYYGAPRQRISVCPYYADYMRIDAARALPHAAVRAKFALAPADRILFSAARLVPEKGLDLMIDAFLRSGFAARGWKYVIAGTGFLEAQLKAQAAAELGKSIHFVGFQQPADNLALMAQAQLLALPSRYEPHGIVVAEALAAGTPVLASDVVGAAYDLVEHGRNGLIFRSEDVADLARKLDAIDQHPDALATMHAAARPSFEAWYRRTSPMLQVPQTMARLMHQ
jgi:glycosyltransferase involved in cell wall biosynthesis